MNAKHRRLVSVDDETGEAVPVAEEEDDDDDDDDGGHDTLVAYARRQPRVEALDKIVRRDVLPLLPVRALLRFRCVSRSFRRHISTPIFALRQTQLHRSLSGVFRCDHRANHPHSLYLPFAPASANAIRDPSLAILGLGDVHVAASSGGLVCCSLRPPARSAAYVVCNPASPELRHDGTCEDYAMLPPSPYQNDGVALMDVDGEYALVCTFPSWELTGKLGRGFAVFTSREWWTVSRSVVSPLDLLSPHGVVAGGRACWRAEGGFVVCHDVAGGRSEVRSAPGEAKGGGAAWRLSELGGKLCCVCYSREEGVVTVHVENGDDGWVAVRVVEIGKGLDVRPVTVDGGGGEVVLWVEGWFLGCCVATGERRELCEMEVEEAPEFLPYSSSFAFVEKMPALWS